MIVFLTGMALYYGTYAVLKTLQWTAQGVYALYPKRDETQGNELHELNTTAPQLTLTKTCPEDEMPSCHGDPSQSVNFHMDNEGLSFAYGQICEGHRQRCITTV